ncbi:hypothetical protein MTP99_009186 [Tenebrio molitor]|jgi:hypothetical protein|uniref:chitin deacetylase 8-like n=1 Tax=Tenebrio molitor TaxID=7067 RepID=UPI001C3BC794|nr:hypothetical protein MTP99_009186 [Tenebrio molitor]CAH1367785.1 unnamed protein product [Tenebrio molitor]
MKVILYLAFVASFAWGYPSLKDASVCKTAACMIENDCRCSSTTNPISATDAPQLIAITVSESVVATLYEDYLKPILFDRTNPDGKPIGATFYVNHEYTDYTLVQDLYLRGYEIGVHSVTKNSSQEYWRHATLEDLVEEFYGQRQIISHFANIPIEDIVGGRTPQLQLEGDLSIEAYVQSGLTYDNSWPTSSSIRLFPYTLDYKSTQECLVTMTCPTQPHEHFWIAPLTNIQGNDSIQCNSLATCNIQGSAQEIADWLIDQVDSAHQGTRAPLILRLDSYWFQFTHNSYEGFVLFLDEMSRRNDLFFVSVEDIVNWMKNPVSAANFQSTVHERYGDCAPISCSLKFLDGSERWMKSCVSCPLSYPWKGNPMGK